ncbi:hypothetical protein B0O80DRAFT_421933 [Mortierella sp. GBAus27b]|nr:hypothetical protein B0O80DRAFT_421933 [Mortierella sp. GBAus27b]
MSFLLKLLWVCFSWQRLFSSLDDWGHGYGLENYHANVTSRVDSSLGNMLATSVESPTLNWLQSEHGPFVMNTKDEIYKTFVDYQFSQNGFERARDWHSNIARG